MLFSKRMVKFDLNAALRVSVLRNRFSHWL